MSFNRPKKSSSASTEEILKNIAECSKNAGKRLATYWVVLLYGVITLAGITDKDIFLNTGVDLPIIGTNVPLTYFWIVYPIAVVILFTLFTTLLFHLKELQNSLSRGIRTNSLRQYPWFWTIRWFWPMRFIILLAFWLSTYLALLYNTMKCLAFRNDILWKYNVALLFLSIAIVIAAFLDTAFRGKYGLSNFQKILRNGFIFLVASTVFLVCTALILSDKQVIENFGSGLNVSYQILVEKPTYDHSNAFWINLSNRDYEGANLTSSVLIRSKLDHVNFEDAKLTRATLDSSSLIGAHLEDSNARILYALKINADSSHWDRADLTWANLKYSRFDSAYFNDAILYQAHLQGAWLRRADMRRVDLQEADLDSAWLEAVDLSGANNLTVRQLRAAYTLKDAHIESSLRDSLETCCGYLFIDPYSRERKLYPPFGDATWPPDSLDIR